MKKNELIKIIIACLTLSGCSVWNDDFDEPVVRAMPKASIHKISTLIDQGVISEKEENEAFSSAKSLPAPPARLAPSPLFTDGRVSRGFEDVRRVFLLSYEDSDKTLRGSRHLYVVVRPAYWREEGGSK